MSGTALETTMLYTTSPAAKREKSHVGTEIRVNRPHPGTMMCGVCGFQLANVATVLDSDVCSPSMLEIPSSQNDRQWFDNVQGVDLQRSIYRGCKSCGNIFKYITQRRADINRLRIRKTWRYGLPCGLAFFTDEVATNHCSFDFVHESLSTNSMATLLRPPISSRRLLLGSTGGDCAMAHVSQWLNNCRTKHTSCHSTVLYSPARLLYIDGHDPRMIKIVQNPASGIAYAALSHRWTAATSRTNLTKNNLQFRSTTGLDTATLPRAMQDTISLLRKLRIAYLWIDSLCIIQDDTDDWKREAASMSKVYSNAELTISATLCQDSDDGLFSNRAFVLDHQTVVASFEDKPVFLRPEIPHIWDAQTLDWKTGIKARSEEWPLFSRGWVYQEEYLARRTLFFSRHEITWVCRTVTDCECGHYAPDHYLPKSPAALKTTEWEKIVEAFSDRAFTFESDRLPAIAGVAKATHEQRPEIGMYMCGLWQNEPMAKQLIWRVRNPWKLTPRIQTSQPSWTWASVNTGVEYVVRSNTLRHGIRILGGKAVLRGDQYMGDVQVAEINILAPLVPAILVERIPTHTRIDFDVGEPSDYHVRSSIAVRIANETFLLWPDFCYEANFISSNEGKTFALILYTRCYADDSTPRYDYSGLLLRKTDAAGTRFQRIGYINTVLPVQSSCERLIATTDLKTFVLI